jgi:dihydroorotate dehydrogenase (fumarate)
MGREVPVLEVNPPLQNSAIPWATTLEDLQGLYDCPSLGAITTRTSLLNGFPHDPAVHQYTFFNPASHECADDVKTDKSSLNTLGYSPIPLKGYLGYIQTISDGLAGPSTKPVVVSVTGTPDEVAACYRLVAAHSRGVQMPLAVEVNLSCPNIPHAPPPAYSGPALAEYLTALADTAADDALPRIPFGLKMPPYTHAGQFDTLVSALRGGGGEKCPLSFLTATNTLGSCLVLGGGGGELDPKLPGLGIGGMAGVSLHPLALGNVATLRRLLDEANETRHVKVIGIGGVDDAAAYKRMRSVGASVVGIGTAFGRKGLDVFREIEASLDGSW